MDFECCQFPVNTMKDFDCKMVKFYHSVLRPEVKRDTIYADHIKRVKTAYHKETISRGNSDISFSSPATRCAYVFLYCASFGSTTAYHFLQLLKRDCRLQRKIAFQDTFHVCCLGGGPGTEIAAIAKILDGYMHSCYCHTRRKPLLIKATVIDVEPGWSVTAENLIRSLPQLVDESLIRCELDFVVADLTEPLSRQVIDAINDADLVTMVKFLSSVNGSSQSDRCDQMLLEVISCIKDGTLFFIDSSSSMHSDVFLDAMSSFPDMTETYGPLTHDLYKMSVYSIAESIKLNEEIFGWLFPCTFTINYVSAWQKGTARNPAARRPSMAEDETSQAANIKALREQVLKHFHKCVKFCSPKSREMEELRRDCDLGEVKMFKTKTKIKRIEI